MDLATPPPHVTPDQVFDFDIYADARVTDDVQTSIANVLAGAPDTFYTPRNGGHWLVRRLDAVAKIMKDYEHFSAREMKIPRIPNHPVLIPLTLDPPQSTPYRHAMMPAFSAKAVRDLEPKIRNWAARLVGEVAGAGECDFVDEVASLFPVSVFMELMGMPLDRLREFRALSASFFNAREPAAVDGFGQEIVGVLGVLVAQRRLAPGADMVSQFLEADFEGRKLTTEEVLAMCFLLFLGGMDTVTKLTAFAFRQLARDPDLQDRLRANHALIPAFVDESLRSFPVVNPSRLVIKDCDLLGVSFRAGDMVMCLLGEAGRDERANPDPARFDIDRRNATHLTFSTGPHLCLGHILARTEIRILTEEWLTRVPAFAVKSGSKHGFRMGAVTALESLTIQWTPTGVLS